MFGCAGDSRSKDTQKNLPRVENTLEQKMVPHDKYCHTQKSPDTRGKAVPLSISARLSVFLWNPIFDGMSFLLYSEMLE
jgi:hypothetical protein